MKERGKGKEDVAEDDRHSLSAFPFPLFLRLGRALRGGVTPQAVALEALRRGRVALGRRRERASVEAARGGGRLARLRPEFARLSPAQLLEHFRTRESPKFFPGFEEAGRGEFSAALRTPFGRETSELIRAAEAIERERRWPLLGFGALEFGAEVDWLRDPVSGVRWPLEFHADVSLLRPGGGDVRVLWELNRLAHVLTLARAYAASGVERFAAEALRQVSHWRARNPVGLGPNWACAMEAALRATNLLAAFQLLRRSTHLDEETLASLLAAFDEHGAHIRRNLEFSHVRTSNHYLSDVAGLFWLGLLLPELLEAEGWREWALKELLREMDKQVLDDGADYESSTGYQRFVTELFLYSFVLARENKLEIDERYWQKLRSMLEYARAVLRPDGLAPLVGDADGGRVLPLNRRAADEYAYLLGVGAVVFKEPRLIASPDAPEEVFWLCGLDGLRAYHELARPPRTDPKGEAASSQPRSRAFKDAGTYVLRDGDLYLLLNACGAGLGGRGSHAHNDALSVEVSARGACFIRDPGTYVYTGDLRERHLFRSTSYHSTVEVDGSEQNATRERLPFVIGDEARPRLVSWEDTPERTLASAEHHGYERLAPGAVRHRRTVTLDKSARLFRVEDALEGRGRHAFRFFFHLAPDTDARVHAENFIEVCDRITRARLLIVPLSGQESAPTLEPRFSSRDYGAKQESRAACWTVNTDAPLLARWALVPVAEDESAEERLKRVGGRR